MTSKYNRLTSAQLTYGLEGDDGVKDKYFPGLRNECAGGTQIEVSHKFHN